MIRENYLGSSLHLNERKIFFSQKKEFLTRFNKKRESNGLKSSSKAKIFITFVVEIHSIEK